MKSKTAKIQIFDDNGNVCREVWITPKTNGKVELVINMGVEMFDAIILPTMVDVLIKELKDAKKTSMLR